MILYILSEEPSVKKVLDVILPKILPENVTSVFLFIRENKTLRRL